MLYKPLGPVHKRGGGAPQGPAQPHALAPPRSVAPPAHSASVSLLCFTWSATPHAPTRPARCRNGSRALRRLRATALGLSFGPSTLLGRATGYESLDAPRHSVALPAHASVNLLCFMWSSTPHPLHMGCYPHMECVLQSCKAGSSGLLASIHFTFLR